MYDITLDSFLDEFEKIATRAGVKEIKRLIGEGKYDQAQDLASKREAIRSKYVNPQAGRGESPRGKITPRKKGDPIIPGRLADTKYLVKNPESRPRNPIGEGKDRFNRNTYNKAEWPSLTSPAINDKGQRAFNFIHDPGSIIKHIGKPEGEGQTSLSVYPGVGLTATKHIHDNALTTPQARSYVGNTTRLPGAEEFATRRITEGRHPETGAHILVSQFAPGDTTHNLLQKYKDNPVEREKVYNEHRRVSEGLQRVAGEGTFIGDLAKNYGNVVQRRMPDGSFKGKAVDFNASPMGSPFPKNPGGSGGSTQDVIRKAYDPGTEVVTHHGKKTGGPVNRVVDKKRPLVPYERSTTVGERWDEAMSRMGIKDNR